MPRVLILRTFSHTRIWEHDEVICRYPRDARDIIRVWERNLLDLSLNDVQFALGIYTQAYFDYVDRLGRRAYAGTMEEDQISLLAPRAIDARGTFAADNGFEITVSYNFHHKFQGCTRQQMIDLDNHLVRIKSAEIGEVANETLWPSLCFTVDLVCFQR